MAGMGTPVAQLFSVSRHAVCDGFLHHVAVWGSRLLLEGTLMNSLVRQAGCGLGGVSLVSGCLSGVRHFCVNPQVKSHKTLVLKLGHLVSSLSLGVWSELRFLAAMSFIHFPPVLACFPLS